jgi:hypothetical protein
MIDSIVNRECQRYKDMGYDTTVTPISIIINYSIETLVLGNDSYILAGIRISDYDTSADQHIVSLSSPSETLRFTQRELATMGQATHKLFRQSITITTTIQNENWTQKNKIPAFRLEFIKISPRQTKKHEN